ncbi:conserved hypothetical protein [Beggiatoa sp. PS]|nr:conserved hypothetical protein [Beggiatoa sp. PS]
MPKKVQVMDTSILLVWLGVPAKDTLKDVTWDKAYVENLIKQEEAKGTTLVLPLATLIEAGNHIAQVKAPHAQKRYPLAKKLADILVKAIDEESPWAAFTEQSVLWEKDTLKALAEEWPSLAAKANAKKDKGGLSMGDVTIKRVAEYYTKMGNSVEILTGDEGLKSYQPIPPKPPRRRRR